MLKFLPWAALLLAFAAHASAGAIRYVGLAHDLDSGRLVYAEVHEEFRNGDGSGRLLTEYIDPEGRLIARREVRFGPDPLLPAFEVLDADGALLEGVRREGDRLAVLYLREGQGLREAELPLAAADVADAGFTRLVQKHWDTLLAGESVRFRFLVPSRLGTVNMRVRVLERSEILGEPAVSFRLELSNALLRWLVDAIDVSFHAENRELLRYVGISNIREAPGQNFRVRIDFPPETRQAALAGAD
jgi:hypothetical protein